MQDRFRCGAAGVRQISERDVIAHRERVAGEVLVHDAVEPVQGVLRPLVDGGAVDADLTRGWPIQSGQQLDDGRLARPVRSDERVVAARLQREADTGEHRLLRIGVGKADAVELDALDRSPRLAPRERRAALFQPAEGGQIDQKLAVLGDTRGNLDDLHGYKVLRLQQRYHRRGVEGEVDRSAAQRLKQRQHGGDDTADHDHAPGSEAEPCVRVYLQVLPPLPVERRTPAIVYVLRVSEQGPLAGRVPPLQDASRQILGAAPEDRQTALQPVHAPPSSNPHENERRHDHNHSGNDPPSDPGQYDGDSDHPYDEARGVDRVIERLLDGSSLRHRLRFPARPHLESTDQVHRLRVLDVSVRQARPLLRQVDPKPAPQARFDPGVRKRTRTRFEQFYGEQ